MPNRMKLRIKSLKQYSCLLGCFSWVLVIFVGLEIQAFLSSANTSVKLVILLLIILSLVVVLFLEVWKKKQGPGEIYKIKISCTDREALIASCNSIPISENANVIMLSKDKYKIRICFFQMTLNHMQTLLLTGFLRNSSQLSISSSWSRTKESNRSAKFSFWYISEKVLSNSSYG